MLEQPILKQLKEMKYRLTACRKVIISIFENSDIPLTVQEINRFLKRSGIRVNKTTIYRELDLLKRLGFVKEVEFGDGKKRFENAAASHHHHFVCQNCESVSDIKINKEFEKLEQKLVKPRNFQVTDHILEFFGLCRNCQTII